MLETFIRQTFRFYRFTQVHSLRELLFRFILFLEEILHYESQIRLDEFINLKTLVQSSIDTDTLRTVHFLEITSP